MGWRLGDVEGVVGTAAIVEGEVEMFAEGRIESEVGDVEGDVEGVGG